MNVSVKQIDFIQFIVIDLFCGAGGTTLGFEDAEFKEIEALIELQQYLKTLGIESFKDEINYRISKVVACVNHDPIAIKSHWANHPEVHHFEEDITAMYGAVKYGILFQSDQFKRLVRLIDLYRAFYPNAKIILWASLECTNFSKAKGGKPRDADSRTLADHLKPYIVALNPDYVMIENVVEFMSWGPLDANGKPISRKNGTDWNRWRKQICDVGYRDEWREMNSADFGALTSRNRLFGCFAKADLPIVWPEPTHSKNPEKTSIYKPLKKWQPVKHALDFSDEGQSVFNRKKPLSTKTMQRLYMGCIKHIAGGKEHFLMKYYSGRPEQKNASIDNPSPSITTFGGGALAKCCFVDQRNGSGEDRSRSIDDPSKALTATGGNQQLIQTFLLKNYSGKPEDKNSSIENPAPVVTTKPHESLVFLQTYNSNKPAEKGGGNNGASIEDPTPTIGTRNTPAVAFISRYNGVNGGKHDNSHSVDGPIGALGCGDNHAKVTANFLMQYYSQGGQLGSIEEPAKCIPTKDRIAKAHLEFFIDKQYSGQDNHQSIEQPAGAILQNDKHSLVGAYLMNTYWGQGNTSTIENPCPVVIARQDKAPLYLIRCETGPVAVPVYEGDCEWTIKLKEFMALYGITDIKMRMLKVLELKVIQGFPADYILLGNQTDQKKFIGNAVHKLVPEHWIKAKSSKLLKIAA